MSQSIQMKWIKWCYIFYCEIFKRMCISRLSCAELFSSIIYSMHRLESNVTGLMNCCFQYWFTSFSWFEVPLYYVHINEMKWNKKIYIFVLRLIWEHFIYIVVVRQWATCYATTSFYTITPTQVHNRIRELM